jgi:hypothetical protein
MKQIQKDELYAHVSGFLKTKGIQLKKGSYSGLIQNSCHALAEAINLGQKGVQRARTGLNQKLGEMREFIHRQTAPRRPANPPAGAGPQPKPRQPRPARNPKKPLRKPRP